jgi:tetratricopeptide (TPR) repeat protein
MWGKLQLAAGLGPPLLLLLATGCSRTGETARFYADPKICASCHPSQSKTYSLTGMGRSFSKPTPASVTEGTYYHPASDRYYTIVRRGDRFFQSRHQKGPDGKEINVIEAEIHYVMGSGNHSRTYLHRTAENRLMQLPVSWYAENGGSLAMSPGYDSPAHQDFRRPVSYTCFACHNAYPQTGASRADSVYPAQLPEGIDCQRCHGPGQTHVQAVQQNKPPAEIKAAIVNPKRLTGERELEVCLQCHLETTSFELPNAMIRHGREVFSYRPGEPLGDYQLHFDHASGTGHDGKFEIAGAAYRLRQSACFNKSAGAMRCTTCHDPHDKSRVDYRTACLKCHAATLRPQHAAETPCTGCHMPKRRTEDVVHVAMTDHLIAKQPASHTPMAPLRERHGNAYRGEVMLYYPRSVPVEADRELYLSVAQVAQQSNLAAGLPRLEAAVRRYRPERAEFYIDLALAYTSAGDNGKAIAAYRQALEKDANSAAALRGLGSALVRSGDAAGGAAMLERAKDGPTLHELARAYRQLGRAGEAIAALEAAVKIDPDLTEARDSLGNMLLETGNKERAEQELREAIRRQPDFASAYGNLANALMAKQAYEEAESAYKKSITLDPSNAIVRYNYGGALAGAGRFPEAEAQLKAAANLPEANGMLGDIYARRREWRQAIASYQAALSKQPQLGQARLGLGIALAASGDVLGARPHLQQAAGDPNPQVRQAAAEVLGSLGR